MSKQELYNALETGIFTNLDQYIKVAEILNDFIDRNKITKEELTTTLEENKATIR